MFSELELLLNACPRDSGPKDYQTAIIEDNVLGKKTMSTRQHSFRSLRELYGLSRDIKSFRSMIDLWDADVESRQVLAVLCASTRDHTLKETANLIVYLPVGGTATAEMLSQSVESGFPGVYKDSTLATIGRNTASTWSQSGHLHGRSTKTRVKLEGSSVATTYALFMGYLEGVEDGMLFDTVWSRLLDSTKEKLMLDAMLASRNGWLEYRRAGNITEINFHHLDRRE